MDRSHNNSSHWSSLDERRAAEQKRAAEQRAVDAVVARWSGLLGSRYLGARDGTPRHLVAARNRVPVLPLSFTVHLSFGAATMDDAREQAVNYAEALSIVRSEIAIGASRLSYADAWHQAERLFCATPGPDGETCADVLGHPGFHRADGLGGLAWGDGDPGRRP